MSSSSDDVMINTDKRLYPRTGKRGVPQTFPRKLHRMLQSESDRMIVHWSTSGRAFRISNVSLFSTEVLPKYFKTSKFSSFQRNLNLYGFTKIRKGPEIDMYFHAGFSRGDEDGLCRLRKRTKAPIKKNQAVGYFPSEINCSSAISYSNFQRPFSVITTNISTREANHKSSINYIPSCSVLNSERLKMLADVMVMMTEGE